MLTAITMQIMSGLAIVLADLNSNKVYRLIDYRRSIDDETH